jgi:hypothetical protein
MTDRGHGSPYDRGHADAWYGRSAEPHMGHGHQRRYDLTQEERDEYMKGYSDQDDRPGRGGKDWR